MKLARTIVSAVFASHVGYHAVSADGHTVAAGDLTSSTMSDVMVADTATATFKCMLSTLWSSADHPVDYPNDAHYSPPVLVSHSDDYTMWLPGSMASPGVEMVAETGNPSELKMELSANMTMDDILTTIQGVPMWNNNDTGMVPAGHIVGRMQTFEETIDVSPTHNYLSSITMLAPSPDWFTGFSNFVPAKDGKWYQTFVIDTNPFDAGTDSGITFTSPDDDAMPKEPIMEMTLDTQNDTGIFVNTASDDVLPLATWECTLDSHELVVTPSPSGVGIGTTMTTAGLATVLAVTLYYLW